ncbi:hypothetical protein [Actinomadura rubrisoli]|uniref:Uncharacterized protein n=1 Tax=Actinomadura rubrisoli TaxID=2530368 RepID=A0A4V2YZH5_9ACTN|nr:hypothetical protein [Actinomadura rubrisoli]TDD97177.1 hypothetical protein E1298_01710 [Actinomadura rubrisoli]
MAEQYYPFDTGTGASVTDDQWTTMARNLRRTGIEGDISNESLKVKPSSSTRASIVSPGEAWVIGHQYLSNAEISLPHAENISGKPRIDLIVLRIDRTADTIHPVVITGVPADNPVTPDLLGNHSAFISTLDPGAQWDLPLGQVRVEAGAAVIAADKYTDIRWLGEFATTTGTSGNRNPYWGMRPFGSIHFEYDTRRWAGWDGYKWGIIAEYGPFRPYTPVIQWQVNDSGAQVTNDSGWSTQGRWRYVADNAVDVSIYAKLNYDINDTQDNPISVVDPESFMRVTLPVPTGNAGDAYSLLNLFYQRGRQSGDMRTGYGLCWSNRENIARLVLQGTQFDGISAAGNLDTLTNNTRLSKNTTIRISGVYEAAGI